MGAAFLGVSFFPIRKLVSKLPAGNIRQKWNFLSILILFFLFGYLGYSISYWEKYEIHFDLLVPVIFFFGSIFVLMVGILSLQTAMDLNLIHVLKRENITDTLIGIYNRRHFDFKLIEEFERAHRYDLPLSLLMLDIDHFKKINDIYGHQTGDMVLKSLGQLILKNVRETDIVARYGGEEIAIITPHTSVKAATDLAERLCRKLESSPMIPDDKYNNRQSISITVSIGVAGLDGEMLDEQSLIKGTDEALYEAKRKGRNQVVVFRQND